MEFKQDMKRKLQQAILEKRSEPSILMPYSVVEAPAIEIRGEDIEFLVSICESAKTLPEAKATAARLIGQLFLLQSNESSACAYRALQVLAQVFLKDQIIEAAKTVQLLGSIVHDMIATFYAAEVRDYVMDDIFDNIIAPFAKVISERTGDCDVAIQAINTLGRLLPTPGYGMEALHKELYTVLVDRIKDTKEGYAVRSAALAVIPALSSSPQHGWVVVVELNIMELCQTLFADKDEHPAVKWAAANAFDVMAQRIPQELWRKQSQVVTPQQAFTPQIVPKRGR